MKLIILVLGFLKFNFARADTTEIFGANSCSGTIQLLDALEIAGVSYSTAHMCTNGYVSFGDQIEILEEPDDFLRDDFEGVVFVPFLLNMGSDSNAVFYQANNSYGAGFTSFVNYLFFRVPADPDFAADFLLILDWVKNEPGQNLIRAFLANDNNYKNTGSPRLYVLLEYNEIGYFQDGQSGQFARAGIKGPNFC